MRKSSTTSAFKQNLSLFLSILMVFSCFAMLTTFTVSAAPEGDGTCDLVITDITWSPESPLPGTEVTFSATVKNQGTGASPAGVVTGVRFSTGTLSNYFAWSDTYSESIPAGGSVKLTSNGGVSKATWTAVLGYTDIIAWVDDQERIKETDTTNNQLIKQINVTATAQETTSAQVTTGAQADNTPVDLSVTKVSATSASVYDRDFVTLTAVVRNNNKTVAAPMGTKVTFAADNKIIQSVIVREEIPADSVKTVTTTVYWRAFFGSHKLYAIVNDDAYVKETSYTNNQYKERTKVIDDDNPQPKATTAPVAGQPDLVITAFNAPTGVKEGDAVKFTATIRNQGTAKLDNKKIDLAFTVDGATVSNNDSVTLEPGQSITLTSGAWTAGDKTSYTATAKVNNSGAYAELSTTNNTKTATFTSTKKPVIVGDVTTYPNPTGIATDTANSMTAGGKAITILKTRANNNHSWNTSDTSTMTSVGMFDFEGTIEVKVTFADSLTTCIVRPTTKGVKATISGKTATFTISEPGQFSVEPNGDLTKAVIVFANKKEVAPSGNVRILAAGQHASQTVAAGEHLYLAPGAVVRSVSAGNIVELKSNATISGRGIIDGSKDYNGNAVKGWIQEGNRARLPIVTYNVNNVTIKGITVFDSNAWNYQIQNSSNVTIDDIKMISARPNGDGISIQSSDHVTIKNSFIRTWDDGIVVKNYSGSRYSSDIIAENCVLWTDLAQSMELGFETNKGKGSNPIIKNVVFNNIYVIHALHKAPISIHNGDNAAISGIKFTNIYIDDSNMGQGDGWNLLFDITNLTGSQIGGAPSWTTVQERGSISDVTLDNIHVLGGRVPGSRFDSSTGGTITGVKLSNITIMGTKITSAPTNWNVKSASISFS